MKRWIVILALIGGAETASAQVTSPTNPSGYAPNFYNRNNQPLSPYLNLLRGGNNAVNYFYGVRPGVAAGGYQGMFNGSGAGPRQTFFPFADNLSELADDPRDASRVNPTGHPAAFFNTLGYFGAPSPVNRQQGGGMRRPMGR